MRKENEKRLESFPWETWEKTPISEIEWCLVHSGGDEDLRRNFESIERDIMLAWEDLADMWHNRTHYCRFC